MSKSIIFLVKYFLGNFDRHLAIFFWSHWLPPTAYEPIIIESKVKKCNSVVVVAVVVVAVVIVEVTVTTVFKNIMNVPLFDYLLSPGQTFLIVEVIT